MEHKCKSCNPWYTLWWCPRSTMRMILDEDPRRWIHVIVIIAGALMGLLSAFTSGPATQQVAFSTLISYLVAGAIFNLITVYILGLLLKWVGHWFGGEGSYLEVRSAVAWSNVPIIWLCVLKAFELLLIGSVVPMGLNDQMANPTMAPLAYAFLGINLLLSVWIVVILVRTVAEAHRFGSWHSLFALILSLVIFTVGFAVVAGLGEFVMDLPMMGGLHTFGMPTGS
jgi:hypothetical protein